MTGHTTLQSIEGKTFYWGQSLADQEAILFHELSHISETLDNGNDFVNEADWLERLYMKGTFDRCAQKNLREMAKEYCKKGTKPGPSSYFP